MNTPIVAEIEAALAQIDGRIADACALVGRDRSSVTVVAVSKKQPDERVAAYLECCARAGRAAVLGENYVQEFKRKREAFSVPFRAHLIGPLQRNKVRDAVKLFDVIESVHSVEIAEAIEREAERAGKRQEIYLQVNVSGDPAKHGFTPQGAERFFVDRLTALRNLVCVGLMTITELYPTAEAARPDFRALRELGQRLEKKLRLSMGMSQDYPVAIEEGATEVRIGTALFGTRSGA